MLRDQPSKGLSPMERFMHSEEAQQQAAQNQSMAEDDLSPLIPIATATADMNGQLLSQDLVPLVIGGFVFGTLHRVLLFRSDTFKFCQRRHWWVDSCTYSSCNRHFIMKCGCKTAHKLCLELSTLKLILRTARINTRMHVAMCWQADGVCCRGRIPVQHARRCR